MIVGIHQREREDRFASADVRHRDSIRDERHLAHDRQWTDLSDVEEPLRAAAGEEWFVDEIDEVVPSEGNSDELSLLQVDWKQLCNIHRGYREHRAVGPRDDGSGIDWTDRSGAREQRAAKAGFDLDFCGPEFPAG